MADFVFNVAKGSAAYYASQAGTGSAALVVIPLETTSLESNAVLKDKDTVTALLSGNTNEQSTMGRKTISSATVTVDDSGDEVTADVADITWSSASGNAISALVVAYSGNTGTDTDDDLIPLTYHDFVATPDGNDITASVTNFYTAS